ncbi:MAG: T9SS type A sorting domain-containing protein [Flavobacteriales bacterium]|nr:T9SS type A sorting domain-containing protein [Flavobacteriales bacterium]
MRIPLFLAALCCIWSNAYSQNNISWNGYASFTDEGNLSLADSLISYEYPTLMVEQITEFNFAASVMNEGVDTMNVYLFVFVDDDFIGSSDTINLAPGHVDTLSIPGYTPSEDWGYYEIEFAFQSDSLETDYSDNAAFRTFRVHNADYSRDKGTIESFMTMDYDGASVLGSIYEFYDQMTIQALEMAVSTTSDPNIDVFMEVRDPVTFEIVNHSDELVLLSPSINGNEGGESWSYIRWYYFALEDLMSVEAGDRYLISISHDGGSELSIGLSSEAPDGSAFYATEVNEELVWSEFDQIPMIRVTRDDYYISTEDNDALIPKIHFFPNPSHSIANVQIELKTTQSVLLELRDVSGKLILFQNLGVQPAGIFTHEMDVSSLPVGSYQLTIHIDQTPFTQQLVIMR